MSLPPDQFDPSAERRFVAAVLRGDQEAVVVFEERMRCISRILVALNARRGRPFGEHDLADLSQDTTVIALRKLPEYQPHAPLEGWLYRVCCLEFMNALRRRGRDRRMAEGDVETMQLAEQEPPKVNDDVHVALEKVGGTEAETIRLKHFEGLTFAEIAARMGVPENTAKTRYYRGMTRLEALLAKYRLDEESKEEGP